MSARRLQAKAVCAIECMMKTMQELYNEVMADKELKAQFVEAANAGKLEAFLKEHGCEATAEEVKAFLEAKANEDAPLSFDELENAAGGDYEMSRTSDCCNQPF